MSLYIKIAVSREINSGKGNICIFKNSGTVVDYEISTMNVLLCVSLVFVIYEFDLYFTQSKAPYFYYNNLNVKKLESGIAFSTYFEKGNVAYREFQCS